MSKKSLAILSLVAALFVALAIIGQSRNDTAPIAGDTAGAPLLADLGPELDSIEEILVTGAGDERLVTLERGTEDWTVTELGGYAADRSQINSLLIALAEASIVEEKTADPAFHSRLGLEDVTQAEAKGLELDLVTTQGDRFAVILGDTYTGGQRYARLAGADQAVLIDQSPDIARDPSDWVDPAILDIAAGRMQRVEITHADGERLVIRKGSPGDANFTVLDIPDGRELQYAGVANVTGNLLGGLRLDDVEPGTGTTGEPSTTTEFWTFDGLVVTVAAYPDDGEDSTWLEFRARYDQDQVDAFSDESSDDEGAAGENGSADVAEGEAGSTDVPAEVDAINARLSGWAYQIPSYQLSQLTRRMEDLLNPAATE